MFNWVCPRCGKDVPPSRTECPYCPPVAQDPAAQPPAPPEWPQHQAPSAWQPPAPPQNWAPPPPPPSWQPPAAPLPPPPAAPVHQQPQQQPWQQQPPPPMVAPPPAYPQQQYHPAHAAPAWAPHSQKPGPPTWLMGLGFAIAFLALGTALYFGIQRFGHTNVQEKAGLEDPANPSQQKVSNPLQKYVEVVGIRMVSDNKKPAARFIVVNHSSAEISGLEASVTLWASTSRSEEDSVGSFTFKLPSLGANSAKELTEPLKTKLRQYELPDWQNATAEIQITSPRR